MPTTPDRIEATWLTIPEAAEYLSVSIFTVRRWIADGDVEAMRLSKRLMRIKRESLDTLGTPLGGTR